MTIITKNGSRVPLLADVAHIKDPTGVPSAIVLTINDITAQKEQERRNHLITTLLDLFVKTTSRKEYLDAVIQTIREWIGCDYIGIRMLNESGEMPYESLLGFTEDFIRKENDVSLKDTCTCARVVTQAFESQDVPCVTPGGSFHCGDTSKFVDDLTEDGRQRFRGTCTGEFASVTIVPIRCGDRICGVIHLADDKENRITPELMSFVELIMAPVIGEAVRRFDAESSLRESESKYRTLAEHLPAITYTRALDEANTILFMSPQVESMFGFSPADFKESPELWRNQIHHDDRERVLKSLAEAKGKREAFVVEYRLFDKQGRAIWVEDRGAVVANDNGQPLYIQGVMYDITVQKDADQLLRGLTAHLSLAEERERKRLAGALHDSLSQTLALSKIKLGSLSRMMKTEASSAALQEVRDLFSQAVEQSRTLTFELSPPILYELGLRAAVDWLGEKMSEQYGFTFVLEDGTDTWSDMDESLRILMFQSIRELMINAGKHAGATKLSVNLARRNGTVVAVVSDNGKGFDVKSVRKRAHETQSIGLFSIEERMRHIGGEFLIESTPGTGTRMTLSAPTTSTTTTKGS
jgi:PAS domain S-box-containing protein